MPNDEHKQQDGDLKVQMAVLAERLEGLRISVVELKSILLSHEDKFAFKSDLAAFSKSHLLFASKDEVDGMEKRIRVLEGTITWGIRIIIGLFLAGIGTVIWKG